jgi:hypothetical protein
MNTDYLHHSLYPLPQLSDEAVIEIREFLEVLMLVFDARYGTQIHRYYDDRSQQNIVQPHPPASTDDPPF